MMAHSASRGTHGAEVRVLADPAALTRAAADLFVTEARAAIDARGRFAVALSGGSTPRALYGLLATEAALRDAIAWDRVHLFWGDERHVPPEHEQSNYRMVREALLDRVRIAPENVHRIAGETSDADAAAQAYQAELRAFFGLAEGDSPRLDLVLLGLGADAHTASLFPGAARTLERRDLVVAHWVESAKAYRVSLTAPVLNAARTIAFIVSGADKAQAVQQVVDGARDPLRYPAQLIEPADGRLVWLLDRAASSLLPPRA